MIDWQCAHDPIFPSSPKASIVRGGHWRRAGTEFPASPRTTQLGDTNVRLFQVLSTAAFGARVKQAGCAKSHAEMCIGSFLVQVCVQTCGQCGQRLIDI